MTTEQTFLDQHYLCARQLPSGEWLGVQPMLYTVGLFLMDADSWRTRFCYERLADAMAAYLDWDGEGDPPGPWIKQKPQDRLNPAWLAEAARELKETV